MLRRHDRIINKGKLKNVRNPFVDQTQDLLILCQALLLSQPPEAEEYKNVLIPKLPTNLALK